MTCDAGASSGPALLRCSSPCCASRTEPLSILQLFTTSSFCKLCTHKIFFFPSPSLLPSLRPSLSLFPVEMLSVPHSASSTRSSTCTGIPHADLHAGSVGPVQIHPLPYLPLHGGFSPGRETVVTKERGWCELKCCWGEHLAREPTAPVHAPMRALLSCRAAHFPLGCGIAIFTDWG